MGFSIIFLNIGQILQERGLTGTKKEHLEHQPDQSPASQISHSGSQPCAPHTTTEVPTYVAIGGIICPCQSQD